MPRTPTPPSIDPTPLDAALIVVIGAVDVTEMLVRQTLGISDTIAQQSTCDFELDDADAALDLAAGNRVIVAQGAIRYFAGSISTPTRKPYQGGGQGVRWRVRCVDLSEIAARHLVARVYDDTLAGDIVRDIVARDLAGEGFTTVGVEDGPLVSRAVFNYRPASGAFDDLCGLTGYSWSIDSDGDVHFFAQESHVAPVSFTETSGNFATVTVDRPRDQYRNRQIVRGGTDLTDPRTEAFAGNDSTRTFTLAFPVGVPPGIRIPGVDQQLLSVRARENEDGPQAWEPGDANTLPLIGGAFGNIGNGVMVESAAAGSCSARLVIDECPGVVAGNLYTFTIYARGARTQHVELEWLDASGTPVGARSVGGSIGQSPGAFLQSVLINAVAPAGAVTVRPYIVFTGPTGDEQFLVDTASSTGDGAPVMGVKGVDADGSHTWYWQPGSTDVTQDQGAPVVTAAQTVEVTYQGTFPLIVVAQDDAEIAVRAAADGGSGLFESIEENQEISSAALASDRADALLRRFGKLSDVVTIDTDDGFQVAAGQLLTVDIASAGVAGEFLIQSVSGRDLGRRLTYTIKAVSGEVLGGWVDFFARLAAQGRKPLALHSDEVILTLQRINDPVLLSDLLDVAEADYAAALVGLAEVGFSEVAATDTPPPVGGTPTPDLYADAYAATY